MLAVALQGAAGFCEFPECCVPREAERLRRVATE
jgi:hypothetical protein